MEYLSVYGWALLIVAGAVAAILIYVNLPTAVTSSACRFSEGFYCNGVIFGTGNNQTLMVVSVTNKLQYAMMDPNLIVAFGGQNQTVSGSCFPNYLASGGSAVCEVPLSSSNKVNIGQYLASSVYLKAKYCGPTVNNCTSPPSETYIGNVQTHATTLVSPDVGLTLTVANTTNPASPNVRDALSAQVIMLGYPLKGATVNFTENDSSYNLTPKIIISDSAGNATSYISGSATGKVNITATYAGMSASLVVTFTQAAQTTTSTTSTSTISPTSSTSTTSTSSTSSTSSTATTTIQPTISLDLNPYDTCSYVTTHLDKNCSSGVRTLGIVNVSWIITNPAPSTTCSVYVNRNTIDTGLGSSGYVHTSPPPADFGTAGTENTTSEIIGVSCSGTGWGGSKSAYAYMYAYNDS